MSTQLLRRGHLYLTRAAEPRASLDTPGTSRVEVCDAASDDRGVVRIHDPADAHALGTALLEWADAERRSRATRGAPPAPIRRGTTTIFGRLPR